MTCLHIGCFTLSDGARCHTSGCPEYLGLPDVPHDGLCECWPSELTAGPCILDRYHPEPDHVNTEGLTWVTA